METGDSGDDDLDAYMAAIHQQHAAAVAHSSARSSRGRGRGRTRGAKERLASALSTKVGPASKGFHMLTKLGLAPGAALGRGGGGRLEPVAIALKQDRLGLGRGEEIKAKQVTEAAAVAASQVLSASAFRRQRAADAERAKAARHLQQAILASRSLDLRGGHQEVRAWVRDVADLRLLLVEALDAAAAEGGGTATACSASPGGDDTSDIQGGASSGEPGGHGAVIAVAQQEMAWHQQDVMVRLTEVLAHLRRDHAHCFYCGVTYGSQLAMQQTCPGPAEDDH